MAVACAVACAVGGAWLVSAGLASVCFATEERLRNHVRLSTVLHCRIRAVTERLAAARTSYVMASGRWSSPSRSGTNWRVLAGRGCVACASKLLHTLPCHARPSRRLRYRHAAAHLAWENSRSLLSV